MACALLLFDVTQLMTEPGDTDAAAVLREICCLLADYCSTLQQEDTHKLAADYYFVSMLPIGEVCDRFNDQKKVLNSIILRTGEMSECSLLEPKCFTMLS